MKNLLWVPPNKHAAVRLAPPEILLCALQPRQIFNWRTLNSWADAIEMIIFTDEDPPEFVKVKYTCVTFAKASGHAPHLVVNAPVFAHRDLARIRVDGLIGDAPSPVDALERYGNAVRVVGRALRGSRCAWIQPESDHSFGACMLTQVINDVVVAYSSRPMIDSLGAIAASKCGVNVRIMGAINAGGVT